MTMLTEDQRAVLQELTNIGMGQAGDSIARVWDEFVHLSIPSIAVLDLKELPQLLKKMAQGDVMAAARQAFHGAFWGEVIVVVPARERDRLAELMGYQGQYSAEDEQEMFLDMANILSGACVTGLADQLEMDVGFSAPSLIGDALTPEDVLATEGVAKSVLSLEVHFTLENRSLRAYLLILFPAEELVHLTNRIDNFLESLLGA